MTRTIFVDLDEREAMELEELRKVMRLQEEDVLRRVISESYARHLEHERTSTHARDTQERDRER